MRHALAVLALSGTIALPFAAGASSHAEAPAIADDPALDNTDLWAWQDTPTTMTILAAYDGLSLPGGGPIYKKWVPYPQAVYEHPTSIPTETASRTSPISSASRTWTTAHRQRCA